MRMNLAVMDWVCDYNSMYVCMYVILYNENVNRTHTSARKVHDLRRPDRRTAMKVLVEKSFNFVDVLWAEYVQCNTTDLQ